MSKFFKICCGFVLPGSVLFAVSMLAGRIPALATAEPRQARLLCFALLAAALLLSMVFRNGRVCFAVLTVCLGYLSVEWLVPRSSSPSVAQALVNATAVMMALNLCVLSLLRDRGVISPPGVRRLLMVATEAGMVIAFTLPAQARAAQLLQHPLVQPRFTQWSRISQPVMVVFAVAAAVLLVRLAWRRRAIDNGLFWALATVFFGFNTRAQAFSVYASGATLILVAAVLETSYTMAYRDELTNLPGRRALNESLLKLGSSYAVGMVDVDHFKNFNDTYGHQAGDQVLRKVARTLETVGGNGKPYRYGGEEFAVIFSGTTVEEAFLYLDRVRQDIEQTQFALRGPDRRKEKKVPKKRGKNGVNVTVSVGIAGNNRNKMTADEVVRAADKALYRAKAFGRNCTVAGDAACR